MKRAVDKLMDEVHRHKCNVFVGDESVIALPRNPRVKSKYWSLITKSFVECRADTSW